jgi:hypothetical protein
MSDSEMVKFLAGVEKNLPMKLAEENCHAESVTGSKGSSARTQVVSEPVTVMSFL